MTLRGAFQTAAEVASSTINVRVNRALALVKEQTGADSTGEAEADRERPGAGQGPSGGEGGGLAGNWVLTELLPHGPTPTGRVLRRRAAAATIAASRLSPSPLWREHRTNRSISEV